MIEDIENAVLKLVSNYDYEEETKKYPFFTYEKAELVEPAEQDAECEVEAVEETDDEEKRKFLEKTEVPATKTPYEPCPVPEQTEKIITPAETKKLKIKQEFLTIYEMIPQKRRKETLYGILISAFIVLLFAILL